MTPTQLEIIDKGSKHASYLPCRTGEIIVKETGTNQQRPNDEKKLRFDEKAKPYSPAYSMLAQFQANKRAMGNLSADSRKEKQASRAAQLRARSERSSNHRVTSPRGKN